MQGLLRDKLGFDGIVCTDWGLITDAEIFSEVHEARAWGRPGRHVARVSSGMATPSTRYSTNSASRGRPSRAWRMNRAGAQSSSMNRTFW
uniref:Glycoside hydrolase family 3 N-terminal domain-containing protein n=1 Tax=Streptomyces sp. NBC_00119 TaxID=2975659 RepID=A0AAU1U6B9_9ACTN